MPRKTKHRLYQKWFDVLTPRYENTQTAASYAYGLCWICDRCGFADDNSPPTLDEMVNWLDEAKVSSERRKNCYKVLRTLHQIRGEHDLADPYKPLLSQLNLPPSQVKTKREKDAWVDFKVLKAAAKDLRAKTFALDKGALWSKDDYKRAQLSFLMTFHLKYPARRDVCRVRYNAADPTTGSVLVDKTREIVIRTHKTRKTLAEVRLKLDRNMWRLAQLLRKQHALRGHTGEGHLLRNCSWKALTPNAFTMWFQRELGKCCGCEGKKLGCTMLRKIKISHKRRNEMSLAEKQTFATQCMHSVKASSLYRRCD